MGLLDLLRNMSGKEDGSAKRSFSSRIPSFSKRRQQHQQQQQPQAGVEEPLLGDASKTDSPKQHSSRGAPYKRNFGFGFRKRPQNLKEKTNPSEMVQQLEATIAKSGGAMTKDNPENRSLDIKNQQSVPTTQIARQDAVDRTPNANRTRWGIKKSQTVVTDRNSNFALPATPEVNRSIRNMPKSKSEESIKSTSSQERAKSGRSRLPKSHTMNPTRPSQAQSASGTGSARVVKPVARPQNLVRPGTAQSTTDTPRVRTQSNASTASNVSSASSTRTPKKTSQETTPREGGQKVEGRSLAASKSAGKSVGGQSRGGTEGSVADSKPSTPGRQEAKRDAREKGTSGTRTHNRQEHSAKSPKSPGVMTSSRLKPESPLTATVRRDSFDLQNESASSDLESDDLMLDMDSSHDESFDQGDERPRHHRRWHSPRRNARTPTDADGREDSDTLEELDTSQSQKRYRRRQYGRSRAQTTPSESPHRDRPRSQSTPMKPPRQMTACFDEEEGVTIDTSSFRYLLQDMTGMKTCLLKLKRILQEVETSSPFDQTTAGKGYADKNHLMSAMLDGAVGEVEGKDMKKENEDLRQELAQLRQQLTEKDRTISLLQTQMEKYSDARDGHVTKSGKSVATQTEPQSKGHSRTRLFSPPNEDQKEDRPRSLSLNLLVSDEGEEEREGIHHSSSSQQHLSDTEQTVDILLVQHSDVSTHDITGAQEDNTGDMDRHKADEKHDFDSLTTEDYNKISEMTATDPVTTHDDKMQMAQEEVVSGKDRERQEANTTTESTKESCIFPVLGAEDAVIATAREDEAGCLLSPTWVTKDVKRNKQQQHEYTIGTTDTSTEESFSIPGAEASTSSEHEVIPQPSVQDIEDPTPLNTTFSIEKDDESMCEDPAPDVTQNITREEGKEEGGAQKITACTEVPNEPENSGEKKNKKPVAATSRNNQPPLQGQRQEKVLPEDSETSKEKNGGVDQGLETIRERSLSFAGFSRPASGYQCRNVSYADVLSTGTPSKQGPTQPLRERSQSFAALKGTQGRRGIPMYQKGKERATTEGIMGRSQSYQGLQEQGRSGIPSMKKGTSVDVNADGALAKGKSQSLAALKFKGQRESRMPLPSQGRSGQRFTGQARESSIPEMRGRSFTFPKYRNTKETTEKHSKKEPQHAPEQAADTAVKASDAAPSTPRGGTAARESKLPVGTEQNAPTPKERSKGRIPVFGKWYKR
ncbi:hypothetical protein Bbelb_012980 [Branchiostoma belcheri]|nr:hypothetical protein Bbelb_012980 [Branchiostoma belcheri]